MCNGEAWHRVAMVKHSFDKKGYGTASSCLAKALFCSGVMCNGFAMIDETMQLLSTAKEGIAKAMWGLAWQWLRYAM